MTAAKSETNPAKPYDLSGQSILITGASGGIGAATAKLCAALGARVLLSDLKSCDAIKKEIVAAGGTASAKEADLQEPAAAADLASWAGAVDAAILAAGLYRPVGWTDPGWEEEIENALSVNLIAPMRMAKILVTGMVERGGGRLVLIGSQSVFTGGSFPGVGPHYAVSKGGLHTLVRWLAVNYGQHKVLVNGVAPGTVDTAMIAHHDVDPVLARQPLKRAARPEEIAWPLAFLCSPGASFVSGAILDVNGGNYLRA